MHTSLASGWLDTNMFGFSLGTRILIWVTIIAIIGGAIAAKRNRESN